MTSASEYHSSKAEWSIKIQAVSVTEDNNVVSTMILEVSTWSFPVFFAII